MTASCGFERSAISLRGRRAYRSPIRDARPAGAGHRAARRRRQAMPHDPAHDGRPTVGQDTGKPIAQVAGELVRAISTNGPRAGTADQLTSDRAEETAMHPTALPRTKRVRVS